MIFNQIKYKWQNNIIEITDNILSSMAGEKSHQGKKHFALTLIFFNSRQLQISERAITK